MKAFERFILPRSATPLLFSREVDADLSALVPGNQVLLEEITVPEGRVVLITELELYGAAAGVGPANLVAFGRADLVGYARVLLETDGELHPRIGGSFQDFRGTPAMAGYPCLMGTLFGADGSGGPFLLDVFQRARVLLEVTQTPLFATAGFGVRWSGLSLPVDMWRKLSRAAENLTGM